MTNWFNNTIQVLDNFNALFAFDDAFGERKTVKIPHSPYHNIRVGGTASSSPMSVYMGCIVQSRPPFEHHVAINEHQIIQGYSSELLAIHTVVYVVEHLSVTSDPIYQMNYFITARLPLTLDWHSVNLDYLQKETDELLCSVRIDPYTGRCRDIEFEPAYKQYIHNDRL